MKKLAIIVAVMMLFTIPAFAGSGWTEMQIKANALANMAREMGLTEDNPIIKEASRIWWEQQQMTEQAKAEADAEFLQSHNTDAVMMAKVMYCEARGISDKRELSMIAWTILNRLDSGKFGSDIPSIITARNQFAYRKSAPTVNDHGVDLFALAQDVLLRWQAEREGEVNVGRTLPKGYCYYKGNGRHNYFQLTNNGKGVLDFGLWNPYE